MPSRTSSLTVVKSTRNYHQMMQIVVDAGYHGYVGIEWEGHTPGELEGIRLTKQLLEQVRDDLSA